MNNSLVSNASVQKTKNWKNFTLRQMKITMNERDKEIKNKKTIKQNHLIGFTSHHIGMYCTGMYCRNMYIMARKCVKISNSFAIDSDLRLFFSSSSVK